MIHLSGIFFSSYTGISLKNHLKMYFEWMALVRDTVLVRWESHILSILFGTSKMFFITVGGDMWALSLQMPLSEAQMSIVYFSSPPSQKWMATIYVYRENNSRQNQQRSQVCVLKACSVLHSPTPCSLRLPEYFHLLDEKLDITFYFSILISFLLSHPVCLLRGSRMSIKASRINLKPTSDIKRMSCKYHQAPILGHQFHLMQHFYKVCRFWLYV